MTTQISLADIQSFYENLAGNFADVVQYNKDNRESPSGNITIPVVCDIMNGDTSNKSDPAVSRIMLFKYILLI